VNKIKRISVKTLKNILSGNVNKPLDCVIKFYSPTCRYCRKLTPLYEQAVTEYKDKTFLMFDASQYTIEDYSAPQAFRVGHMEIAADTNVSREETSMLSESLSYIEDVFYNLNKLHPWHLKKYNMPVRYGLAPFFFKIKTGYAPYVSHIRMLVEPEDWNPAEHEDLIFDMQHLRDFIENDSKKVLTIK